MKNKFDSEEDKLIARIDYDLYGVVDTSNEELIDIAALIIYSFNQEKPTVELLMGLYELALDEISVDEKMELNPIVITLMRQIVVNEVLSISLHNITAMSKLHQIKLNKLAGS